jgi:hypothetical protein
VLATAPKTAAAANLTASAVFLANHVNSFLLFAQPVAPKPRSLSSLATIGLSTVVPAMTKFASAHLVANDYYHVGPESSGASMPEDEWAFLLVADGGNLVDISRYECYNDLVLLRFLGNLFE